MKKENLLSDPYFDDFRSLARVAAVKRWRGLEESGPVVPLAVRNAPEFANGLDKDENSANRF